MKEKCDNSKVFASAGKTLLESIFSCRCSLRCVLKAAGSPHISPHQLSAPLSHLTVTVKYVWANRATYSRKRGLDSSNTHPGPVV